MPAASSPPPRTPAQTPRRADAGPARLAIAHHRGLAMHGFVFAVVAIDLLALNLIANRDTLWAVWPIGIWSIVLAAHAGATLVRPSGFGAHLVGGGATCLGLAIVNVFHGNGPWVIWPTLAWLLTLAIHAPFAFDHLRERRWTGR
ncbi:MAG: 2TM domain-containing protein [Thermomicrobiales bacterium]